MGQKTVDNGMISYYSRGYDFGPKGGCAMHVRISRELARFNRLMGEIDGLYHDAAAAPGFPDSAMKVLYTIAATGSGAASGPGG